MDIPAAEAPAPTPATFRRQSAINQMPNQLWKKNSSKSEEQLIEDAVRFVWNNSKPLCRLP